MIDLYCERLESGLWAEPVNAITNVAFFMAAFGSWWLIRRATQPPLGAFILIALMPVIGVGSFLFHTFATPLTLILDVTPILLIQICFIWLYFRRIIGAGAISTSLVVGLLVILSLVARTIPGGVDLSLHYLPALFVLFILATYHFGTRRRLRWALPAAAALLLLSVVARTADGLVCPVFAVGAHFLWHVLNGIVVFLSFAAYSCNVLTARGHGHRARTGNE